MKLRIVKKTHVIWPVTVNIPLDGGMVQQEEFFARFKRLSEEEFEALSKKGQTEILKASVKAVGETEADIEELKDTDLKELLTDTNYRVGLYRAYLNMDAGVAEKNS